jgi:hypothetical protein
MAEPEVGSLRRRLLDGARRVLARSVAVPVSLDIAHRRALPQNHPLVRAVQTSVADVFQDHLRALRLPGRPDVQVVIAPPRVDDPFQLSVNGLPCRHALGALETLVVELTLGAANSLDGVPEQQLPDVVGAGCAAALQPQLSVLLSEEQLDLVFVGSVTRTPDAPIAQAVRRVLDLGSPAGDWPTLAAVLEHTHGGQSPAELAEALLNKLHPGSLDLLMTERTLRRVTTKQPDQARGFAELRQRLFNDLGVEFPDARFVIDPRLPDDTCAFRLNSIRTWPQKVPAAFPLEHMYAGLEHALRRRASWFVSMADIQERLDTLGRALPDLVGAVKERYTLPWLSAVARCLVEESVSIRDLTTILDRLLDLDHSGRQHDVVWQREGSATGASPIPCPRDVVAYVRQRARDDAWAIARGDEIVYVHWLPEELVPTGPDLSLFKAGRGVTERLSVVVRSLVGSSRLKIPLVVSSVPGRSQVREALAAEFPELAVVASQEYPPWVRLVQSPPTP